ncbi:hypothetical protein [Microbacterium sp. cx-55]|nr:hypothetical protein [Microbacterium sp. cx-55]
MVHDPAILHRNPTSFLSRPTGEMTESKGRSEMIAEVGIALHNHG